MSTSPAPAPKVTHRRGFSLVWVVPLVALGVAAWMLLREARNHGPEITIEFADGSGIEAGKTALEYAGVSVGMVRSVKLASDLSHVDVRLQLHKEAASLARKGSQFWIVHPEFSFSGVHGLETLVRGVRLAVRPGDGPPAKYFRGLDNTPPPEETKSGRAFLLRADRLSGIATGTSVYYRDVKVGSVEATRLADDSATVLIRIRVLTPYTNLVRTNTHFWIAGFSVKGGLFSGLELKNLSIESLFSSGIDLATPEGELAPPAPDSSEFPLADEEGKDWSKWRPHIPISAQEQSPEAKPQAQPPTIVKP